MYRRLLIAFLGVAPSGAVLARGGPPVPDVILPATSPQTAAEIAALQHEVATLKRTVAALQSDYARHVHTFVGAAGEQRQTSGLVAKTEH
jgi:hypothetical protein